LVIAMTCTTKGIAGTLLLIPISTYMNSRVYIWNQEKQFSRHAAQVGNFVH
jgi:hypothetical protein